MLRVKKERNSVFLEMMIAILECKWRQYQYICADIAITIIEVDRLFLIEATIRPQKLHKD